MVRSKLLIVSGNDQWQDPPDNVDSGICPWESWVTYRGFGTPLSIWIKSGSVYTDSEKLTERYEASCVKLCTNRNNQMDIYNSYMQFQNTNEKIMVNQLEP